MAEHAYEQIVQDIRGQIFTGKLTSDHRLPTQDALAESYSVSRGAVRHALDILEAEGLIDRVQGGRAAIRRHQPQIRRSALHSEFNPGAPFVVEALAAERGPRYTHRSRPEPASPEIARRLRIAPGGEVMRTDYTSYANGEPMMIVHSYEPVAITRGTIIERPEEGPLPGAGLVDRFAAIGLRPTAVVERLSLRMPRPSESEDLQLRPGTPVIIIERTTYREEQPLETADLLLDAHRFELEYALGVDPFPST